MSQKIPRVPCHKCISSISDISWAERHNAWKDNSNSLIHTHSPAFVFSSSQYLERTLGSDPHHCNENLPLILLLDSLRSTISLRPSLKSCGMQLVGSSSINHKKQRSSSSARRRTRRRRWPLRWPYNKQTYKYQSSKQRHIHIPNDNVPTRRTRRKFEKYERKQRRYSTIANETQQNYQRKRNTQEKHGYVMANCKVGIETKGWQNSCFGGGVASE